MDTYGYKDFSKKTMKKFIYTLLLSLVAPFFIYKLFKVKPNKPNVGSRWKEFFGHTPQLAKRSSPIWIHSVSVGESVAILPLIKELKLSHPNSNLIITTTTPTGAEIINKLDDLVEHRYMPFDFPFAVRKFIATIKPKCLFIVETEIWPNTLEELTNNDIPVTLINARMSKRSFQGYLKTKYLTGDSFEKLNKVLCQSESDAKHFIQLGVPEQRIIITGSLKSDITVDESTIEAGNTLRKGFGDRKIWIAASTHPKEEKLFLDTQIALQKYIPNLLLLLVPRHPERFDEVYELAQSLQLTTLRRSKKPNTFGDCQVYLGDTMGELMLMLQASDVCVMGGSFIGSKVGGHNFLEPAILSKPIITGPSYYNFQQIGEQLEKVGILSILKSEDELKDKLIQSFSNLDTKIMKNKSEQYFKDSRQATKSTISEIEKYI